MPIARRCSAHPALPPTGASMSSAVTPRPTRRVARPARSPGASCSASRASSGRSATRRRASTARAAKSWRRVRRSRTRARRSRAGSTGVPGRASCATPPPQVVRAGCRPSTTPEPCITAWAEAASTRGCRSPGCATGPGITLQPSRTAPPRACTSMGRSSTRRRPEPARRPPWARGTSCETGRPRSTPRARPTRSPLYTRALGGAEIKSHYDLARAIAAAPLPAEPIPPAAEPPAAGAGRGGGVLAPLRRGARVRGPAQPRCAAAGWWYSARRGGRTGSSRAGGAPLGAWPTARLRCGPAADAAGSLHGRSAVAPPACARSRSTAATATTGSTVIGRIRAVLVGGRGRDRLTGGARTIFRGGPGTDRVLRKPG